MSYVLTEADKKIMDFVLKQLDFKPNESQLKLITPSLNNKSCMASPGSGKTASLTVAAILSELILKIPGDKIHMITFTNKATEEMKYRHGRDMRRIKKDFNSFVKVSTLHSMCKYYLSALSSRIDLDKVDVLLEGEALKSLRGIYAKVMNVKETFVADKDLRNVLSCIEYLNNRMYFDAVDVVKTDAFIDLKMDFDKFNRIRNVFYRSQRSTGILTFDNIMLAFLELLNSSEASLKAIRKYFGIVFVDEAQDTSRLQYEIIFKLCGDEIPIIGVGDADQSIYRWRGAGDFFTEFETRYPSCEKIVMNTNYRCPDNVIRVANALIRNNTLRKDIKIEGTGKKGAIKTIPCLNNKEASDTIVTYLTTFFENIPTRERKYRDHMVLYRNHTQGMFLIYDLAMLKFPIQLASTQLPHKSRIVKDLMGIYKMLKEPKNRKLMHEYMYKVAYEINRSKQKDTCPFLNAKEGAHFTQINVPVKNIENHKRDLVALYQLSKQIEQNPRITVKEVMSVLIPMYMNAYCKRYKIYETMNLTEDDLEMITMFLTTGKIADYNFPEYDFKMTEIEQYLLEESRNANNNKIRVLTIHSAKGMEAEYVYLLDMNGSIQANTKKIDTLKKAKAYEALEEYINEERSLAYVAITRSLRYLIVTYSSANPSPFNLESGLNSDRVAKLDMLSLRSLGVTESEVMKMKRLSDKAREVNNGQYNLPSGKPEILESHYNKALEITSNEQQVDSFTADISGALSRIKKQI